MLTRFWYCILKYTFELKVVITYNTYNSKIANKVDHLLTAYNIFSTNNHK